MVAALEGSGESSSAGLLGIMLLLRHNRGLMDVITYSLRAAQSDSEQYYRDVAAFTDLVLEEVREQAGPVIESFCAHLQRSGREDLRSWSEYALELLVLGVLWREYASESAGLAQRPRRLLSWLVRLRERGGWLKSAVDLLRGPLGGFWLRAGSSVDVALELGNLDRLLGWLNACGEFSQELGRLAAWRDYVSDLPPGAAAQVLGTAVGLAEWFAVRSEAALGQYTPNVERFLRETHPRYRWREDAIFCGRRRIEYHLNMVGAEILNRAFRAGFLDCEKKVVLLPPCIKARSDDDCQAQEVAFGALCAACTPGCRVHQLTMLGRKHGFDVFIMPDDLVVLKGPSKTSLGGISGLGVVGVSCVLTNMPGGWETTKLGVPAQGVLLDYCGCSYHWHKQGIPTAIDIDQLLKVLDISTDVGGRDG